MNENQNILTVLMAKYQNAPIKMFFCPYTKNPTLKYRGSVKAILPGCDPQEPFLMIIHPRRTHENINYFFVETEQQSETVDFYIQDQYFVEQVIRTYHCYNCQAPNLYFAGNKTVMFSNKSDVKKGQSFNCINPLCKKNYTYHGIVKLETPLAVTQQLA